MATFGGKAFTTADWRFRLDARYSIENFFCRARQFRTGAVRQDKTARNFLPDSNGSPRAVSSVDNRSHGFWFNCRAATSSSVSVAASQPNGADGHTPIPAKATGTRRSR